VLFEGFQLQSAFFEVLRYLAERLDGGFAQHHPGDGVESLLHEVVLRRVAHVEADAGDLLIQICLLLRRVLLDLCK
jgi:hypothetical protein